MDIPITTLAGLSSLTELLPQLPLPAILPSSSDSLLTDIGLLNEATNQLHETNPQLADRVSQALASTNVDYLDIREEAQSGRLPNHPLAGAVLARLGYPQQQQQQWQQQVNHHGDQRQQQYVSNNHLMNGSAAGAGSSGSEGAASPVAAHQQQHKTASNFKIPKDKVVKIDLNKLSREDQVLMQRSLKELAKDQRPLDKSAGGRARNKAKYAEPSSSDTDEDQEEEESDAKPTKGKSKFFKHTEKERDDERRRQKDERRAARRQRRMEENDDDYAPEAEESGGRGGRKRRLNAGDSEGEEEGEDYDENGEIAAKRRRKDVSVFAGGSVSPPPDMDNFVPRKVSRKIERKLVPRVQKIDPDTLMESNTFQRFSKTMETVFDNAEEVNLTELEENEDSTEIPPEILVPKYQAADLANEAAKLKSMEAMDSVPTERLVKLLNLLQWNIRDGSKVVPIPSTNDDDDEEEEDDRLFLELAAERVSRAADCALCVMNIMTSKNMNKRVYIDDVIDKVAMFVRFQLQNTIYPSFDPVYKELSKSKEGYMGSAKKKRNNAPTVRDRNILNLYNKLHQIVSLLAELLSIQLMTDTTVLHLSTLGIAPFFVENIPELQLAALKLVTGVFAKYEKHRKLVLNDILASIARLPSTKRSLRTYRLSKSDHIQMLTALVLQLIQCVVLLPERLGRKTLPVKQEIKKEKDAKIKENGEDVVVLGDDPEAGMDRDVLVNQRYESAMGIAVEFLTVFLTKCGSKQEDIDYRPLFENFLQDLLTTVNTPEWPAAELLLSLLGHLLVNKFSNKGTDLSLRLSSLDYLGTVASRLRRDAVQSRLKVDTIDTIISSVKEAEAEYGEEQEKELEKLEPEERRTRFLQRVLLDYLTVTGGEEDANTLASRHFYISQWYRDANAEIRKQKGVDQPAHKKKKKKEHHHTPGRRRRGQSESEESEESEPEEKPDPRNDPKLAEVFRLTEDRKDFLVSKIMPFGDSLKTGKKGHSLTSHIDATSATLIVKFLSSKRPFFKGFDMYLKQIISVLTEQSVQVRSKALKCLASVVHEDPSVLSRDDMQQGVSYSFLDSATMVREAAVDLVGKFILHKQELIDKYYDMLLARILDTGVSVRKRVIKILKDICLEFPDYERIPQICVKMIRRINDEEGIRKLVMEVFHNMWFAPISERGGRGNRGDAENHLLVTKAHNITDVVVACRETGLEWFEQLLQTLFKPKEDKDDATKINREPPKQLVQACQQIVDCLMETVLRSEEQQQQQQQQNGQSHRIVACLTTTYLFAKIRPQLLVKHVQTLQPYLNIKCFVQGDYQIISNVARTLELTVPLIEHPSQIFLSQLEEAAVRLILQHDKTVVGACLSCLGSIVNNVTKNFGLMRDCFKRYFSNIFFYKKIHMKDPSDPRLVKHLPYFRRSLYTVGLLLRYFDFTQEELYAGLEWGSETKSTVFDSIFYFLGHESKDIQTAALQALGFICIRHYDLMMEDSLKLKYIEILTSPQQSQQHRVQDTALALQVLTNIETYLVEEEIRMIKLDKNWKDYAEKENLKEMGDVSSGMASTIIQIFLKAILESFIHPSVQVRHASLKVIQLILGQGLVHPVQIVPYLICMSTDSETRVSHTADRELQEIEKKYPGFIHMKLMQGIRLSYNLQDVLVREDDSVLRGFRTKEGELPTALNGFLYSILRSTKAQRRAILLMLLKQFDESARTELAMKLYLADNLAYIPYTVVDEPLFLIHHIDIMVSVIGSNLLQNIKESLQLPPEYEVVHNPQTGKDEIVYDEDLDEDMDSVMSRLPEDLTAIQRSLETSQGCLLLLILREHLKELYGINEAKIQAYSPSEAQKIYERPVNRKANARFNPKATVEIIRAGSSAVTAAQQLEEEGRRDLVAKYLGFKDLMNKIDKDDDEVDEDGNPITQGPQLNAKDLQNMGMPVLRRPVNGTAVPAPPPPSLPSGIQGTPESFNPVIRIQNLAVSSLPASSLPPGIPAPLSADPAAASSSSTSQPGHLDPETGEWVPETTPRKKDKKTSVTPLKISLKNNQESRSSSKVPALKINLNNKQPQSHAFFQELDKSAKERDERRRKTKGHREKHKKNKKKKKKYQSDSGESEDGSDSDYQD